jgi:hypothetical protein
MLSFTGWHQQLWLLQIMIMIFIINMGVKEILSGLGYKSPHTLLSSLEFVLRDTPDRMLSSLKE